MVAMAKKQPKKEVNRTPSVKIFARIDPEYSEKIKEIQRLAGPYTPSLSQIIEHGIDLALAEAKAKTESGDK